MSYNFLIWVSAICSIIALAGVIFDLIKPWRDKRWELKQQRKRTR